LEDKNIFELRKKAVRQYIRLKLLKINVKSRKSVSKSVLDGGDNATNVERVLEQ